MRSKFPERLEMNRILGGLYASHPGDCFGAFRITSPTGGSLLIIASDGDDGIVSQGWEHVSVSLKHRTPNWQEMAFVKDLFWNDDECVVQFHPPKSEYVNHHPNCLHLWRHKDGHKPPPQLLV
jgi:hypothetical protein